MKFDQPLPRPACPECFRALSEVYHGRDAPADKLRCPWCEINIDYRAAIEAGGGPA